MRLLHLSFRSKCDNALTDFNYSLRVLFYIQNTKAKAEKETEKIIITSSMGTIQIQPNRKMKLWKFQKAIVND